jgi:hypothetical protein
MFVTKIKIQDTEIKDKKKIPIPGIEPEPPG